MRNHDDCVSRSDWEQDMQVINDRWAERHFKECRVKAVLINEDWGHRQANVTRVVWSPDGLIVYVD